MSGGAGPRFFCLAFDKMFERMYNENGEFTFFVLVTGGTE